MQAKNRKKLQRLAEDVAQALLAEGYLGRGDSTGYSLGEHDRQRAVDMGCPRRHLGQLQDMVLQLLRAAGEEAEREWAEEQAYLSTI